MYLAAVMVLYEKMVASGETGPLPMGLVYTGQFSHPEDFIDEWLDYSASIIIAHPSFFIF
jgi:hypothetical protein